MIRSIRDRHGIRQLDRQSPLSAVPYFPRTKVWNVPYKIDL
jgi:hypothetical protein